jgi:hypothetical protein
MLMPNVAGVVFEIKSMRAMLELPLFPGLPWPEAPLKVNTNKISSSRRTSANFEFELAEWEKFAAEAFEWWEHDNAKKLFDDDTLKDWWQDNAAGVTWASSHVGVRKRGEHVFYRMLAHLMSLMCTISRAALSFEHSIGRLRSPDIVGLRT